MSNRLLIELKKQLTYTATRKETVNIELRQRPANIKTINVTSVFR